MLDLGIAAFGNDLVAAWKGFASDQGLYYSSFDGTSWSAPATISGVGSSVGEAIPHPVVPTSDGLSLVPYTGSDAGQLTSTES